MGTRMEEEVSLFCNRKNTDSTDCYIRLYIPTAVTLGLGLEIGDFVQIGTLFREKERYGLLQFIKKEWVPKQPALYYAFYSPEDKRAVIVDWSIPDGHPWYKDRENRAIRLPILQSRPPRRIKFKDSLIVLPGKLIFGFVTGWTPFSDKVRSREFFTEVVD